MKYTTARQLAEMLLQNPDDIVCTTTDNFEQGHQTVPMSRISLYRYKGNIKNESFRDAFDGGSYNKEVVAYDNEKGELNFVKL